MPGRCYTFVSVELDSSIEFSKQSLKKKDRIAEAIEKLLSSDARLLSVQHDDGSWRAILQFASTEAAIRSAGDFARHYIAARKGKLPARIGVSTGEVASEFPTVEDATVKRAIWLAGVAPMSGILLCRATAAIAQDLDLFPYWVVKHGDLFNLSQARMLYIWSLRNNELPEPQGVSDEISYRHNIPALQEFFVGRDGDIEEAHGALRNNRWITLTGVSGIGKSMIAQRVALEMLEDLRDGVRYVDLSGVTSHDEAVSRLFQSIGVDVESWGPIGLPTIRSYFGNRNHLIFLDGCERCLLALRPIIKSLLTTRGVKVLATSTTSFEMQGDIEIKIEGLPIPPLDRHYTLNQLESYDSTALLLDRYRLSRPNFEPNREETSQIAEICRVLDGHPLGIILAAHALRTDSFAEVLISVKKGVLGSKKSKTDRHWNLDASVRWTVQGLEATTVQVLETASVFEDRFSRDDLVEIADFERPRVAKALSNLMEIGLVIDDEAPDASESHRLLPYVRHAMRDSMEQRKEWRSIREQHFLRIYAKFAAVYKDLTGPNQAEALDLLDTMRSDLESALRYLIETQPVAEFLRAMGQCWNYWYRRNRLTSIIGLADPARAKCGPNETLHRARLDNLAAIFETKAGAASKAIPRLLRAIRTLGKKGDKGAKCQFLINLGLCYWAEAQPAKACKCLDRAVAIARTLENKASMLPALSTSIAPLLDQKRFEQAKAHLDELHQITGKTEDALVHWSYWIGLGEYSCETENYEEALRHLDTSLHYARQTGDPSCVGRSYLWRAQTLLLMADRRKPVLEEAAENLGRCIYLVETGEQALYKTNEYRIMDIEMQLVDQLNEANVNLQKMYGAMHSQLDTSIT